MPGWAGCEKNTPQGCPPQSKCDGMKTDESVCGQDYSNNVAETEPGSKARKKLEKACKATMNRKKAEQKMCNKAAKNGVKWQAAKEKTEKQNRERDERARKRAQEKEAQKQIKARNKAERNAKRAPKFTSEPIPDYIMRALKPKKSVHPEYGKLRY